MKGAKGKSPAVQWYYKDWLADKKLQRCSASTRGIWMNILMYMYDDDGEIRGTLEGLDLSEICRLGSAANEEAEQFIREAEKHNFCEIVTDCHGLVTLMSRRVSRDEKERIRSRNRKRKERSQNPVTGNITPLSQKCHNTSPAPAPVPTVVKRTESGRKPDSESDDSVFSSEHFSSLVGDWLPRLEKTGAGILNLPDKFPAFNPFQYIQKFLNDGIHPEVIHSALTSIHDQWENIRRDPWSYTAKMVRKAQDLKMHEGYKKMTVEDLQPDVAKLLTDMAGRFKVLDPRQKEVNRIADLKKQAEMLQRNTAEQRPY